jgi:hypothetical protein
MILDLGKLPGTRGMGRLAGQSFHFFVCDVPVQICSVYAVVTPLCNMAIRVYNIEGFQFSVAN